MSARRAALAAALACNPPATGEPAPAPPAELAPPEPTCEEPPAGALALLPPVDRDMPERTCPWVLVGSGDELSARPLARSDAAVVLAPVPVIAPAGCRPCRFAGVVTAAGPLLLATRPSPGSELADAAWFGAGGLDPGPPRPLVAAAAEPGLALPSPRQGPAPVAFTPLWFDRPGFGDSTLQGPAWALAPHLCRTPPVLVLLPEPRLPGARAEEPPPALTRAAGVYALADGELVRQDEPVPPDMSHCTRVPLELP